VHWETLRFRVGPATPGSIYNYTHGERILRTGDPEQAYVERLLPIKLALELVYLRRASLTYDFRIIARTLATIGLIMLGKRDFADPPEMAAAQQFLAPAAGEFAPTRL
jgi:hypothetical protein